MTASVGREGCIILLPAVDWSSVDGAVLSGSGTGKFRTLSTVFEKATSVSLISTFIDLWVLRETAVWKPPILILLSQVLKAGNRLYAHSRR